jgi:histidine triad (HIT) family protein
MSSSKQRRPGGGRKRSLLRGAGEVYTLKDSVTRCVFCQIVARKLPSLMIFENRHVLVILPKTMEARGHCLIILKRHIEDIFSVPACELVHIAAAFKRIAKLSRERLGATGVNILHASGVDAQQSVPHLHFHLIPRFPGDGVDAWMSKGSKKLESRKQIYKLLTSG